MVHLSDHLFTHPLHAVIDDWTARNSSFAGDGIFVDSVKTEIQPCNMLTKEMEYHPVYSPKETPGYFMSRAKAFLILLAFVSLVIVLIVLAVMLAQQRERKARFATAKMIPLVSVNISFYLFYFMIHMTDYGG